MSRPFRASRNLAPFPRALPWAGMSRPFRAATNFVALSVTLSPLSKAAGKAHAKARKREEWEPRIHANSREFTQNGVSGWSKRAVKSEFKRGFGVGAPHLHLVSTPCLHTLSPHLVSTLCRKRRSKRMFRLPVRFRCAMEPAVSAVLRRLPPALDPRQPHRGL
jgi:hypothetical protein